MAQQSTEKWIGVEIHELGVKVCVGFTEEGEDLSWKHKDEPWRMDSITSTTDNIRVFNDEDELVGHPVDSEDEFNEEQTEKIDDETFIQKAEIRGSVWTLEGFTKAFNYAEDVDTVVHVIRIL
jgi:hypothetical protein